MSWAQGPESSSAQNMTSTLGNLAINVIYIINVNIVAPITLDLKT